MSYGAPECTVDPENIKVFEQLAQKLGVQGVTLVASSGDTGANGLQAIQTAYGKSCSDLPQACPNLPADLAGLTVTWPASSPYVTAVGATAGPEEDKKEVVCQVLCDPPLKEGEVQCQNGAG